MKIALIQYRSVILALQNTEPIPGTAAAVYNRQVVARELDCVGAAKEVKV